MLPHLPSQIILPLSPSSQISHTSHPFLILSLYNQNKTISFSPRVSTYLSAPVSLRLSPSYYQEQTLSAPTQSQSLTCACIPTSHTSLRILLLLLLPLASSIAPTHALSDRSASIQICCMGFYLSKRPFLTEHPPPSRAQFLLIFLAQLLERASAFYSPFPYALSSIHSPVLLPPP